MYFVTHPLTKSAFCSPIKMRPGLDPRSEETQNLASTNVLEVIEHFAKTLLQRD